MQRFGLEDSTSYKTQSSQKTVSQRVYAPIQQGLADLDPDVDAIYRLLIGKKLSFKVSSTILTSWNTVLSPSEYPWYPDASSIYFTRIYPK